MIPISAIWCGDERYLATGTKVQLLAFDPAKHPALYARTACWIRSDEDQEYRSCDLSDLQTEGGEMPELPEGAVVERVEAILSGIGREEGDGLGWWETSQGAEFGRKVIGLIRKELV